MYKNWEETIDILLDMELGFERGIILQDTISLLCVIWRLYEIEDMM